MQPVQLPGELTLEEFYATSVAAREVRLAPGTSEALEEGRAFLSRRLNAGVRIYGVNTGFGPLVGRSVDSESVLELQENLLQQLSCNVGPLMPPAVSRGSLLLRAAAIARGRSGASPALLKALVAMIATGATPAIRAYGSVGASGDLVPLTAMARALRGEGELRLPNGEVQKNTPRLLRNLGLEPVTLGPKEGLALVNGTSFSLSIVALSLKSALTMVRERILPLSATLLALFGDSIQHLSDRLYGEKRHGSARETARRLREWLRAEAPEESHGVPQPPYSARSLSLWLGVVEEHLEQARRVVEVEMNSVDDNPLVFGEEQRILHGANFQGVYAAKAADDLTAALAKAGDLVERQINRLFHEKLNGDLPPFLAPEPVGLHSGLQGFQLLATSLLSDIKAKSVMHGAGSIPTNGDNQDVVSMSANAALNALEVTRKSGYLVAILECSVARALQLRSVELSGELHRWWEERSELARFDYAGSPLDRILEERKALLTPWDR